MPTVKVLHLCHNDDLIHIGIHSLGGLKNLEEIKLSNNLVLSKIDSFALAQSTNDKDGYGWLKIKKVRIY